MFQQHSTETLDESIRQAKRKLKNSKTFIGSFSIKSLSSLLINLKKASFIFVCRFHLIAVYITKSTLEIFDPLGFCESLKYFNAKTISILKNLKQRRKLICNPPLKKFSNSFVSLFIKLRDRGRSFKSILNKIRKL